MDILADHDEISIYQKQLQFFKIFTLINKLNPQFVWCFFYNHKIPYNFRYESVVKLPGTNTIKYGRKNFRGIMIWNIIPKNIKLSETLPEFKRRLKKHLIPCNCAACRF